MLRFTMFDEDKTINTIMPESEIKINAGKESVLGYHLKKGDQSMHYPIFAPLPQIKRHSIVFYNMPSWMTLELTVLYSTRCPNLSQKCTVQRGKDQFEFSKGVIFNGEELPVPCPQKKNGQVWAFFSIESLYLYSVGPQWKNKFSWTITYRRDSDFPCFYGKIKKRETPLTQNYSKIFERKTKSISWAVSNCKTFSKREEYIKKLQKYIDVDIYGRCGKLKCGSRSAGLTYCHKQFAKEFKFYLALENSLCRDYATEKLFNFFFHDLPMIQIVYGAPNLHEYIPKGTFINVMDYNSPNELAKDLMRIGSNETIYTQFLKEKDKYTAERFKWEEVLCPMCVKLHEADSSKVISDINTWILNGTCIKP